MTKLVKIHPRDPVKGYHIQNYIYGPYHFRVEKGWYEVDNATARKLEGILNNPADPRSRPVFIIATKKEAEQMDNAARLAVATAKEPMPLPKSVRDRQAELVDTKKTGGRKQAPKDEPVTEVDDDDDWDLDDEIDDIGETIETADEEDLDEPEEADDEQPEAKPVRKTVKKTPKARGRKSSAKNKSSRKTSAKSKSSQQS